MGGSGFLEGLTGGIQNAMQMRQAAQESQTKNQFLDLQMKEQKMKFEQMKLMNDYYAQHPELKEISFLPQDVQGMAYLPYLLAKMNGRGGAQPTAPTSSAGPAQPSQWQGPPFAMPEQPAASITPPPQQGGALPDIISAARTNPILGGMMKKIMGQNPGEITYQRGVADPNSGKPVVMGLDVSGKPIPGLTIPEAEKPGEKFTQATGLRSEFRDINKTFRDVRDSYGRIQEASKNPSAAGDLAMLYSYMKLLDPGSVVREGEFATAANSGSVPEAIRARYNKAINGERLSDNIRNDFVSRATMLYDKQVSQYDQSVSEYTRLAQQLGINPKEVIVDFGLAKSKGKPSLKMGKERPPIGTFGQ